MTFLPLALRGVAAAGLTVDAYVHLRLAHRYDPIASSVISQGTLFRIEAAAAIMAIALVLLWRRRAGDSFAWLVAAAGLAAILLYRYADIGAIGPLPNMYEPLWYADKVWALIGQAAAVVTLTPMIMRPRRAHAKAPNVG